MSGGMKLMDLRAGEYVFRGANGFKYGLSDTNDYRGDIKKSHYAEKQMILRALGFNLNKTLIQDFEIKAPVMIYTCGL